MEVTLTLSTEEANYVLTALTKMPYGEVSGLIAKIVQQGEKSTDKESETESKDTSEEA